MRKRLRVKIDLRNHFFLQFLSDTDAQKITSCNSGVVRHLTAGCTQSVPIGASNVSHRRTGGSSDWGPDIEMELSTYPVFRKSYTVRYEGIEPVASCQ